jgi:hypothetical protein
VAVDTAEVVSAAGVAEVLGAALALPDGDELVFTDGANVDVGLCVTGACVTVVVVLPDDFAFTVTLQTSFLPPALTSTVAFPAFFPLIFTLFFVFADREIFFLPFVTFQTAFFAVIF